jgi:GxxExxY protein
MRQQDVDPQLNKLSQRVIAAAIEVHRVLGPGFQEQTYQRALAVELRRREIPFELEVAVALTYKDEPIGTGLLMYWLMAGWSWS